MTDLYDGNQLPDANQGDVAPFVNAPAGSMNLDISTPLETGSKDPMRGIHNISRDTNGSFSYGNHGLNSLPGNSAWQFRDTYGQELGLTANPGTQQFNIQWATAAHNDPEKLRSAEQDWYDKNILQPTTQKLQAIGIPQEVASDPHVMAYFADRQVQQGPASITNAKHAARIQNAWNQSGGDIGSFLRVQSNEDLSPQALQSDFPAALRSGVYSDRGNYHRVTGRYQGAMGVSDSANNSFPQDPDSQITSALIQNQPQPSPIRAYARGDTSTGTRRMDDNSQSQGPDTSFKGIISALLGIPPANAQGMGNPYQAKMGEELFKQSISPYPTQQAGWGTTIGRLAMQLAGSGMMNDYGRGLQQAMGPQGGQPQYGGSAPTQVQPYTAQPSPPVQTGGAVAPRPAVASPPNPQAQPQQASPSPQAGGDIVIPPTQDANSAKQRIDASFAQKFQAEQQNLNLARATGNVELFTKTNQTLANLKGERDTAIAAIDNAPQDRREYTFPDGRKAWVVGDQYHGYKNTGEPITDPAAIAANAASQKTAADKLAEAKIVPVAEAIKEGSASRKANSALQTLDTINNLPGSENVNSGPWAEHLLNAKKILKDTLGWDMGGIEQAEGIEKMNTYLSQQAAKELTTRPTQFDFKTFIENNPGIEMSAEGRKMMIDILKQTTSQGVELAKLAQKLKPEDASDWYNMEEKFYKEHPVIIHYKGQSYDTSKPYNAPPAPAGAPNMPTAQAQPSRDDIAAEMKRRGISQ